MARITHARLLAIKGNGAEAVVTLRDVIKDAPENAKAHFILGQVLRQTGDLTGAKAELQEALKRQPDNPMVLYAVAETYRDARDFDTAREYASRLEKLNENNPSAHFLNATIDIGAQDYDGALKELNEVKKSLSNDPLLYLNFALAYAGQKKYADAEREFQTALKLYPQYDAALADYVEFDVFHQQRGQGDDPRQSVRRRQSQPARCPFHLCFSPGYRQEVRRGHSGVSEGHSNRPEFGYVVHPYRPDLRND